MENMLLHCALGITINYLGRANYLTNQLLCRVCWGRLPTREPVLDAAC